MVIVNILTFWTPSLSNLSKLYYRIHNHELYLRSHNRGDSRQLYKSMSTDV